MQMLPRYNPLGDIGTSLQQGLSSGIDQGINRGMLQQGLQGVQGLYKPNAQGQIPPINPGELAAKLAMAFAHIPGGMQLASELYQPMLEQSMMNQLRSVYEQGGYPGEGMGRPGQQQPGASPHLQQLMPPQQQPIPQPQRFGPVPPQRKAGLQQPMPGQRTEGMAQPGQMARDIAPVTSPQVPHVLTSQGMKDLTSYAYSKLAPKQAATFIDDTIKRAQAQYDIELKAAEEARASQKQAQASNAVSNEFLDKKITQNKYSDEFLENEARLKFDEERQLHPNMGDEGRWQIAHRHANKLKNSLSAYEQNDAGRPIEGELSKEFEPRMKRAASAANAFARAANVYDDETGEFNMPAYEKGIASIMKNHWTRSEAHNILVGTSTAAKGAVKNAPDALVARTPDIHWKPDELRRKPQEELDQNYELIARELLETMHPSDSISVIREMLKAKNYNESDFNEILSYLFADGWEPTALQEQELAQMAGAIDPTFREVVNGQQGIMRSLQRSHL